MAYRCARLGVAAAFAVLHLALYRYGFLGHTLRGLTLVSLFAIGVIRNASIFRARHIGYAWALHAAWNLVMFSGRWQEVATGRTLAEPEVFDALLAYPPLVGALGVAAALVVARLARAGRSAGRPRVTGADVRKERR